MSFEHLVLLRPSEICFTRKVLQPKFDNGIPLAETLTQLENGEILMGFIPDIEVVWYYEKNSWYTLNNRRLWVFKELEKEGKCKRIKAQRVEAVENIMDFPAKLYKSASLSGESRPLSYSCRRKDRERESLHITTYCTEEIKVERNERSRSRSKSREVTTVVRDQERRITYEKRVSLKCDYRDYRDDDEESEGGSPNFKAPRKSYRAQNRFDPRKSNRRSSTSSNERSSTSSSGKALCVQDRSLAPLSRGASESKEIRVLPRHLTDAGIFFWSHFHYEVWKYKRNQFFHRVFAGRNARARVRALGALYTCGVCFKSFKAKVSLDQHTEELMHWACVRCGRFFGSFTALGQHKIRLGHTA